MDKIPILKKMKGVYTFEFHLEQCKYYFSFQMRVNVISSRNIKLLAKLPH